MFTSAQTLAALKRELRRLEGRRNPAPVFAICKANGLRWTDQDEAWVYNERSKRYDLVRVINPGPLFSGVWPVRGQIHFDTNRVPTEKLIPVE